MPDSAGIVYVKTIDRNTTAVPRRPRAGANVLVKTETKMNHDVTCSADGVIAFGPGRSVDQIFRRG